ncbi:hypothetical protein GCM10027346_32090 [Hymenobacter seoulensis]
MKPQLFTTSRTARYISLGEPGPDIQHVWFCLHGRGQPLEDFAAQLITLDTPERLLILPEALSRYTLPAELTDKLVTGASWFTDDSLAPDLADLNTYLNALADHVLAACPKGVSITVLGYGHGAAVACRWLANGHVPYSRLILYAAVFPAVLDRSATLQKLPNRPVTLISTTTNDFTPEASGEGLLHDMQEAGLPAQLRFVSEGPLTLAALGAASETN